MDNNEQMNNTIKKQRRIMFAVLAVLIIVVGVASVLNYFGLGSRLTLSENAEIQIQKNGKTTFVVTPAILEVSGLTEFKASLNSDGREPEQHTYTGVPLKDVLSMADIELTDKMQIDILSVDGYMVALSAKEVMAENNIYLVTKDNGEFLGTIDDRNGRGPYMIVIRKDPFSQRWSKYVVGIDVK